MFAERISGAVDSRLVPSIQISITEDLLPNAAGAAAEGLCNELRKNPSYAGEGRRDALRDPPDGVAEGLREPSTPSATAGLEAAAEATSKPCQ